MTDRKLLDATKVMLYSFTKYNPDVPVLMYVFDKDVDIFAQHIPLNNVKFIAFDTVTRLQTFCEEHSKEIHLDMFNFMYEPDNIYKWFVSTEIIESLAHELSDCYDVIMRLDIDTLWLSSVMPSVTKFYASGKGIGSVAEIGDYIHKIAQPSLLDYFSNGNMYLNVGTMMFRMDKIPLDLVAKTILLMSNIGMHKFYCYDQDNINLIYDAQDKYDTTLDGYLLTLNVYDKDVLYQLYNEVTPVCIHYAWLTKPYCCMGDCYLICSLTYLTYFKQAVACKCSKTFIQTILRSINVHKFNATHTRCMFDKLDENKNLVSHIYKKFVKE
jgi:hypothetical protein